MEYKVMKEAWKEQITPSYVFDLDKLKERMDLANSILNGKATVCYAMKANPFLVGAMDAYTEKYEVCSPGEYEICYRQGIAPSKIVISGVNKTFVSMERIMELSKGE